jgi:hypothetical protein
MKGPQIQTIFSIFNSFLTASRLFLHVKYKSSVLHITLIGICCQINKAHTYFILELFKFDILVRIYMTHCSTIL